MISKKLGQMLKDARKARKMNQETVAKKSGINHKETISRIERGQREIPSQHRRAYLLAVGLKIREVEKPIKQELWIDWIGKK